MKTISNNLGQASKGVGTGSRRMEKGRGGILAVLKPTGVIKGSTLLLPSPARLHLLDDAKGKGEGEEQTSTLAMGRASLGRCESARWKLRSRNLRKRHTPNRRSVRLYTIS